MLLPHSENTLCLLSGIGAVHWQYYHQLGDLNEVHLKKIEECASALFLLDNESSYGHRLTSYLRLLDGKTPEAINHLYRAMKGDPNDTETLLWLSYILAFHAGKPLAAKPIVDRWLDIDPMNPVVHGC
jgi:tetratricopeptide (TPR) repeat protein